MVFGLNWSMVAACSAVNSPSIAAPDPSGNHCVSMHPQKILLRSFIVNINL
jgi:hypothetical protein